MNNLECYEKINLDDGYVWTDFYVTRPKINSYTEALIEEYDNNFNNYSVFSLNSHLTNWVASH